MDEPLSPSKVKALVVAILVGGTVSFSKHAYDEMRNDNLTELDVTNTLRGGKVLPGELEHGSWRYRCQTARMCAVIAFRSVTALVIVTAWRFKK